MYSSFFDLQETASYYENREVCYEKENINVGSVNQILIRNMKKDKKTE